MADDLEVGVRLVPDESELDDVEDRTISVQAEQQGPAAGATGGDAAAGGFAGAEAGELLGQGGIIAGLLAGILSQLKPVTQFVKLIFRVLSLALLPAIQLLVVALRPLLTNLAKTTTAIENPRLAAEGVQRRINQDTGVSPSQQNTALSSVLGNEAVQTAVGPAGVGIDAIASILDQQPSSSDLTDEGKKNQQADIVKQALELIP